ncbi:carbohydrate ABC transporter permease [Nakamurella antarctica]|uniref:Carbohydrate ABC transporter permease n=1 Tax=Nakamurella antarctica TaxID=1902245 RepID=A0A3G8ZNR4_9ACTN|nr:carbohydrate ABC transporter permease [Nakamurella antarctica]AZI58982.1 carbohydrate ABC transporter permease [Nakamurella antarctica]
MTSHTTNTPSTSVRIKRKFGAAPVAVNIVLLVATGYFLLPVFWLVVAATKSRPDLVSSFGFWFLRPQLFQNLQELFSEQDHVFGQWMLNSLLYSGVGALVGTVLAACAGYCLAVYRFRGKEAIFSLILGSVLVPATALALPTFLAFAKVGLTDSYLAVLLPSIISPFGVYLSRIYTQAAVPLELLEAGRIDGANEWQIFRAVVLRLISPALVTVFLFQFVGIWNNFFLPLIMLQNDRLFPVTLGLYSWQSQISRNPQLLLLTVVGSLVAVVPLVITFLSLQRYWKAGLTTGSVKG